MSLNSKSAHLMPYDENLLERARTQWQFGDWDSLAKLHRDTLQHHPDRAKLALLAAAGRLQTGQDAEEVKLYIRLAIDWGISKKMMSQILIAGVHNSIGRAASITNDHLRAILHFENAITIGAPDADIKLLTQARVGEQFKQLGLSNQNFFSWNTGNKIDSVSALPSWQNKEELGINKKYRIDELNHEYLIEEIALSKKALLARRELAKSSGVDLNGLVSIIIPTHRAQNIDNIINNISRQLYKNIELILIPHFYNESSLKELEVKAETLRCGLNNLVILKIDDAVPLGIRLNRAIETSSGDYWAKMDDDDIYFENYLSDMIFLLEFNDYAMVGKSEQFIYLADIDKLVLRLPGLHNRLSFISGATFVTNRKYGRELRFGELEMGEDTALLKMADELGLKVYAADCFNHILMRSPDLNAHTWKVSSDSFLKECMIVSDGLCENFVRV